MEENRRYVTLDELTIRELAKNDPKLFLQTYKPPIIIDEIQYAPELLPYIKAIVDESEQRGLFWLTGSQQFELMKDVTESLAGRIAVVEMNSLSFSEKKSLQTKEFNTEELNCRYNLEVLELFEEIFKGGMPDYYVNDLDRKDYFENYIKTYLERDIRNLTQVRDLLVFHKFLISVASRIGEVLNYSNIAKDADVSENTVKKWISVLNSTGIIYLLQPYHNVELRRSIKNPKIIFMDTGLCSYLCKWNSAEALMNGAASGQFVETWVISEIIKNNKNVSSDLDIYYYRDRDGVEIDLIIYYNDTLYPIEIKKSAKPDKSMIKNFKILEKTKKNIGKGGVICLYPDILPLSDNNVVIPIGSIV